MGGGNRGSRNFFLDRWLRNLNYTKFNEKTIWIYQRYQKKKNMQIHEILQIKDKLQSENADMRIIK